MKNRKVVNVRSHLAGLLAKTSYDAEKDRAEMILTIAGVVIKTINGESMVRNGKRYEVLIPFSNCTEVLIDPDDSEDEIKRGPGRPPGPRAA